MRLEQVCDPELAYRREPLYAGLLQLVAPYGTQEGSLYGEGELVVRGARLSGTGRWANHARRRSDGVNLPDVPGATCGITVTYKSGASRASGLTTKTADAQGAVSSTWMIGRATTLGEWPVDVAGELAADEDEPRTSSNGERTQVPAAPPSAWGRGWRCPCRSVSTLPGLYRLCLAGCGMRPAAEGVRRAFADEPPL